MFSAHKEELKLCHVKFDIITGSDFEERFQQAIDLIKKKFNFDLNWGA